MTTFAYLPLPDIAYLPSTGSSSGITQLESNCNHKKQTAAASIKATGPLIMTAFHIVKNTFYILICLASFGSNSLLIAMLLRFEHLRTTANLFVLNLAFCDIATVLLSIPFTIRVEESASYPFGEVGCKILMPGATAAFNSASFTLLAIAIDRFYAIMFPMRARLQSCKTKSIVLCLLHGISVSSVIPYIIHQK